jgi:hypothetical protein
MRNQIFNSPGNEEAKLANIPEDGVLNWNSSFDIGYGIYRKRQPIWVWVLVSHLNQNSGFGRTLGQ